MKRKSLLTVFLAFAITAVTFAQVSTTPEVPKNYKPQPKELLPMPDSLTDEGIFPVLGSFNLTDKEGNASEVTVTRDPENKGIIWISGLPEGKFKALLKASPATYKIPVQKTLANDELSAATDMAVDTAAPQTPKSKVVSGRSIQEGTLIYDKDANTLYVNIGNKFNEENPATVFPEMNASTDSTMTVTDTDEAAAATTKKSKKTSAKKAVVKSVTYTGSKIDAQPAEPAATDSTGTSQN